MTESSLLRNRQHNLRTSVPPLSQYDDGDAERAITTATVRHVSPQSSPQPPADLATQLLPKSPNESPTKSPITPRKLY